MDEFLEKYNLPKLNQEEIENITRPLKSKEIETIIKNLQTNQIPGPDGFTGEFYQTIQELTPILLKLFQKIAQGKLLNPFYEAPHHPNPKTRQRCHKKDNYRPITLMNIDEDSSTNSSKQNPTTYSKGQTS